MRAWGKRIRNEAPRGQRPSLRGTAADLYERPWWVVRIEPYENPQTTSALMAIWRFDR